MSPISFAMLSGAGVIQGYGELDGEDNRRVYVHTTYDLVVEKEGEDFVAKLTAEDRDNAVIVVSKETPVYPTLLDSAGGQAGYLSAVTDEQITIDGSPDGTVTVNTELGDLDASGCTIVFKLAGDTPGDDRMDKNIQVGQGVRIDCYTVHTEGAQELQIDAETFAGYYYIEASTLFRDEATGEDFPAEFVIPRGKIQSNFTFSMANSGDPSTFTFTIDCLPAYTKFDKTHRVLAELITLEAGSSSHPYSNETIIGHKNRTKDEDVDGYYAHSIFASGE